MASRILEVILNAKDNASAVLGKAEGNIQTSASRMVSAFKLIAASAAALAIGKFLKDSIDEAIRAEQTLGRLAQAVTKAGGNFDVLSPQIMETVKSLARFTTFSDDDLFDALSSMILRTNDVVGSQKNLALVADIAASGEMDLAAAADFVSKVMNGQTRVLKGFGIEGLSAADAMDVLTKRFGGQALEKAQTFGGQVTQLSKAWDDFKEAVGLAIIRGDGASASLGGLASTLAKVADFVSENEAVLGSMVTVVVSLGSAIWQLVKYPLGIFIVGLGTLTGATGKAIEALGFLVEQGAKILSAIGIEWPEKLGKSIRDAGKAMSDASANGIKALVGIEQQGQAERTAIVTTGAGERTQAEQDAHDEIARITDQANAAMDETQRAATERQAKEAERRRLLLVGASESQKEQLMALWASEDKAQAERDKKAEEARKQAAAIRQRGIDAANKEVERVERESVIRRLQIDQGLTRDQAEEAVRRKELLVGATKEQAAQLKALWEQQAKDNLIFAAGFDKPIDAVGKLSQQVRFLRLELVPIPTAFAPVTESVASLAAKAKHAQERTDAFREALVDSSRGAIGMAQALGAIGDTAAASLQNVASLGDGLTKLLTGGITTGGVVGAITSVVGSVASLAKSLFGESPEEKARKDLIRKNTEALRGLTQATGDLLKVQASGNQITKIRDFLGGLFGPGGQYTKGAYTAGKMRTGITDAEVEALAAELGISVRNSKSGAIEAKGLFQLFQGLQGLDSGFANTFKGQRERISTGIGLGAITQDQEFAQILKAIESQGGNNAILSALQGADFSTMEGRGAAANTLRDLFTAFGNNQIKADQLGGLSGSEFIDTLGDLIAILTDADRAITGVGDLRPDTPSLDLSTAFGDLSVTFEDIGMQQVDYLASIDSQIGGLLERWTDIDTGRTATLPQSVTVTVGEVFVTTAATDAEGTGQAVQAAVLSAIDEALATRYRDQQLATGGLTRTV